MASLTLSETPPRVAGTSPDVVPLRSDHVIVNRNTLRHLFEFAKSQGSGPAWTFIGSTAGGKNILMKKQHQPRNNILTVPEGILILTSLAMSAA
ncbi:hypothetical protein CSOJ01_11924 [Colletotrichum sojae]|uniref:Uncharacterized protein n=1 Tax=Colletotrichum sojae TaxID=2175907 RepID=A0A8H6MM84_9PEZI|nr:hypothetical protein CSOJ01_11924 [Colletotrichum sojae]